VHRSQRDGAGGDEARNDRDSEAIEDGERQRQDPLELFRMCVSHWSVSVAKGRQTAMKNILTAIDGSLPSYRALAHAASLAAALRSHLGVLLVRQFVVGRHDVLEVWTDAQAAEIRTLASDIIAKNGNPDHEFIEQRSRDVAYAIVETAVNRHADLIVMGASGMGSLKAFVLGSVSLEVLRKAACPVTIVH